MRVEVSIAVKYTKTMILDVHSGELNGAWYEVLDLIDSEALEESDYTLEEGFPDIEIDDLKEKEASNECN